MPLAVSTFEMGSSKNAGVLPSGSNKQNQNFIRPWMIIEPFFFRKAPLWKRVLDISGALFGLVLFSPLFLIISIIIKIVSPGPIFFYQERFGYGGKKFNFIKFRTMDVNSDPSGHQEYLSELISSGEGDKNTVQPMIKLDDENAHIIPLGRFLRDSCLDELPQLINVLRGEMSLVGPRPPIPYEVAEYKAWHNCRFDALPGMTGLWQVSGKNRLTFGEMVRLDIQYLRNVSFLSDVKIILRTPVAIINEILHTDERQLISRKGCEDNV
jgi:lipopolysaccharide/colanic/teichoic acid biosynthesis glycosyltransferase